MTDEELIRSLVEATERCRSLWNEVHRRAYQRPSIVQQVWARLSGGSTMLEEVLSFLDEGN